MSSSIWVSPSWFFRDWRLLLCLTLAILKVMIRGQMASPFHFFIKDITEQDMRKMLYHPSFLHLLSSTTSVKEKLREEELRTLRGLGGKLLPVERTFSDWFQNVLRFYLKITSEMLPPCSLVSPSISVLDFNGAK